jgi:hypothetical protein
MAGIRAPRLTKRKTRVKHKRGSGFDGTVSVASVEGFKGPVLIKVPTRPKRLNPNRPGYKVAMQSVRRNLIAQQKAWFALFKAGLPVPRFHKIDLRRQSKHYLSTFMEDMSKRFGKIYTGHIMGVPVFFDGLSLKRDRTLIRNLAKDLAKINGLGYFPEAADFWSFYRKNASWDRVIFDFGAFGKPQQFVRDTQLAIQFGNIAFPMPEPEFAYFVKQYKKHCAPITALMLDRKMNEIMEFGREQKRMQFLNRK